MVRELRHQKYLILGLTNAAKTKENKGDDRYDEMIKLNKELAKLYGDHFIDIWAYLISQYNPLEEQDVIDHEQDVIPASLTYDNLHMNAAGYTLVAKRIYASIDVLLKQ